MTKLHKGSIYTSENQNERGDKIFRYLPENMESSTFLLVLPDNVDSWKRKNVIRNTVLTS